MDNFEIKKIYSKHFRERKAQIEYIIIHSSAYSVEKNIEIFNNIGVSAHYIIGKDGSIIEQVSPELVAYHSGKSSWFDKKDGSLNEYSIGIELEAPYLGQKPNDFSKKEIESLLNLLKKLSYTYNIKRCNILGHSDIAVLRKPDPGVCFPWKKLAKHGFGVWYDLRKTDKSQNEEDLLKRIGYDCSDIFAARYAFCRHFFGEEIVFQEDICKLLDCVYVKDFVPLSYDKYLKTLKAVCYSFDKWRSK
ncbi:MAG: N-acetylmuramoyl-L-alanine amidase [Alphaproteobacteria bacterium]|nr:N-acetylmuramoyl-L-alanine amidase [Alphaproteobacteria bacterium]